MGQGGGGDQVSTILPIPQTFKLVDENGSYTVEFKRYLDQVLARIGGITGGSYTQLTNGTSISWDLDKAPVSVVLLKSGANTLSPPLNMVAGLLYRLTLVQPASGAAGTMIWPKPPFLFPGGVAPALSSANNAIDECWFSCDGTNLKLCVEALNFS